MQIVETLNEGLKRAYTLTVAAQEIDAKVDAEVKRVAPQVKMPGFRPGKVPANLVRKMHGDALAQDALNSAVQEGVQNLLADRQLRPAMQPSVELGAYARGKDAEVTVALEVLPAVPTPAIEALTLERLTVPVEETQVEAQLQKFADGQKTWDDAGDREAAHGDQVTVDFAGRTANGVAFEGGTGSDMAVEIGAGRLIPGFEEQIVGAKAGEERQIAVTFPDDYPAKDLAGKAATFDLVIKSVKTSKPGQVDDAMAMSLGLESLDQLRTLIRGQIEQELNGLTRTHMKRKLLDQLAAGHDFEVPPSMVDAEFEQIWAQLEHEATHEPDPAGARAEMEAERGDYRTIAERRVRLGLLLSEIGQANGVEVNQQEMNRLVAEAAQRYPKEQQQQFIQYIQQEPMAAAQLRAPLYEDKVVDYLFGLATVTDRESTREELEAAIESEDGFVTGTHVHNHEDHDHAAHDHAGHGPGEEAAAEPASEAKPKRKAKVKLAEPGAPIEAETQVLEASPVAAEAAEGAGAADAPRPKKPRAKKAVADVTEHAGEG